VKINIRKLLRRKQASQSKRVDFITALNEIESRGKACLKAAIPYEAAEKLNQFLKDKGLPERRGIPLLIKYGLSDESVEELGKLKLEKES